MSRVVGGWLREKEKKEKDPTALVTIDGHRVALLLLLRVLRVTFLRE